MPHQCRTILRELVIFQFHILEHFVHVQPLDALKVEQVRRHHLDGVAIDVDKFHGIVTIHHSHIAAQGSKVLDVSSDTILSIMIRLHHLGVFVEHRRSLASDVLHAVRAHNDVSQLRRSLRKNQIEILLHLLFQLVQSRRRQGQLSFCYLQSHLLVALLQAVVQLILCHKRGA